METRADYVLVGGVVLAILAAVVAATLWLARIEFRRAANFYDIYFTGSVTGLSVGSPARYNGIPVGRVVDIRIAPQDQSRVRVTLEINVATNIREDAVASLEVQGLTGTAFVEITGGGTDAPILAPKGEERYPVISSRPSGLQQVYTSAPEVLTRLIAVADRLADLLGERNQAALGQTLDNLRQVTGAAAAHSKDIGTAIDDGVVAIHELKETLATTNATIASLDTLVGPKGEIVTSLKAIDEAARKLGAAADRVDQLVQANASSVHDFTQRGLPDVTALVGDTRRLVAELTRLSEAIERDPSRFIYGNRRDGYRPP